METLYILGSIGGIVNLVALIILAIYEIGVFLMKYIRNYRKYKEAYYEKAEKDKSKLKQVGFMTKADDEEKKEFDEIAKILTGEKESKKKECMTLLEETKNYENYYDEYWETVPVDDEFVEEEEDEEDKYPLLKETVKRQKER